MPHTLIHAVVWLDFHQAKIFLIKAEDVEAKRVKADTPHRQIHHKAQVRGSGHVRDDRTYFEAILAAIEKADSWLIVGPGQERPREISRRSHKLLKACDQMIPHDPLIARALRGTARG